MLASGFHKSFASARGGPPGFVCAHGSTRHKADMESRTKRGANMMDVTRDREQQQGAGMREGRRSDRCRAGS